MSKKFKGVVISNKMDKTVLVKVEQIKEHPLYKKKYRRHKSLKVHDEKNEYKVGDTVEIAECRPISKDKHFRVVGKVKSFKFERSER